MKIKWELEDRTVIEGNFPFFGRNCIRVDGKAISQKVSLRKKANIDITFGDSQSAVLTVTPTHFHGPTMELKVDGRLMKASTKETLQCPVCSKPVIPNDRYCASCGVELPSAEHYARVKRVTDATGAIRLLAFLFMISGVILFFATRSQADEALTKLASMSADSVIPENAAGASYTVAQLREQLAWAPWGVLIVNTILAAVMAMLAVWGKRSPLAAVLVACGTYAVVIVLSAITDPASMAQGLYMKIFIIAVLVKGIRSSLELRTLKQA